MLLLSRSRRSLMALEESGGGPRAATTRRLRQNSAAGYYPACPLPRRRHRICPQGLLLHCLHSLDSGCVRSCACIAPTQTSGRRAAGELTPQSRVVYLSGAARVCGFSLVFDANIQVSLEGTSPSVPGTRAIYCANVIWDILLWHLSGVPCDGVRALVPFQLPVGGDTLEMDRRGAAPRQGDQPLPDGGAEWGRLGRWAAAECR